MKLPWQVRIEQQNVHIEQQNIRIETLEAALRVIMAAVEDEEWDKAPPHIHEIARTVLGARIVREPELDIIDPHWSTQ